MGFFKKYIAKTNLLCYNDNMKEYKETQHSLLQKSVSDLSFYSAGYEECKPKYSYGPICRSYNLIHFVLKGKGVFKINEHVFNIKAGDAFIIPAGKVSYYEADENEPWHYAWINYIGINSQLYTYNLVTSSDDNYVIRGLDTEKYKDAIMGLLSQHTNTASKFLKANAILLNIISMLYEDVGYDGRNQFKTSSADDIKFYIDMHFSDNIKLNELAKRFGIHPNYMTRVFREAYGVSPKKYLTELKLKKACRLLTVTNLPVSVISSSLGFEDQLSFSRAFKNGYDVSPSDYRKKSRERTTE